MSKSKPISPHRLASLLRLQKDPKFALELFRNPNPNPDKTLPTKPFRYSVLHYDLIITRLGRAKMFDEMEQILQQLKQDTRIAPKEIIFCNVINFYGRARLLDQALQLFDEMPGFRVDRTVKSFNTLLNQLLRCRKFDKTKEVFEIMEKHMSLDACSYNILINGCVMSGRLKDAWFVFREMLKKGLNPSVVTFGTLVYGLCSDSQLEEALRLKEDMVRVYNVKPNGHVYASLIKGLCEVGDLNSAIGLKVEMVRDKVELDSGIYSTLISAMFKLGRKEAVSVLKEEMRETGCKPDTVTYNVMINGFINEKDFEGAFRMLNEMKERGCKADVISYNLILGGLCKERKWSEANDLFEDMPRRGCIPDVVSYRILFDGLCDGMQFEEAALILDEMIFKGYAPRCEQIYKFVDALCWAGNAELLWAALNTLVKGNFIDFEVWRRVISKVCKEEALTNAFELVETLIVP